MARRDRYGESILAMRLKMQQRRQEQERAELLQREQMNNQREMQGLDMMLKSGRAYFDAMKLADDRDLKLAMAKHQMREDEARRKREDLKANAEADAKIAAAHAKLEGEKELVDRRGDKQMALQDDRQRWSIDPKNIAARERIARAGATAAMPVKTLDSDYKNARDTRKWRASQVDKDIREINAKIKQHDKGFGISTSPDAEKWRAELIRLRAYKEGLRRITLVEKRESVDAAVREMNKLVKQYLDDKEKIEAEIDEHFGTLGGGETMSSAPSTEAGVAWEQYNQ